MDRKRQDPQVDYRRTRVGRLQSWFGLKRHVKWFMSLSGPNAVLRAALHLLPALRSGRLPAPANIQEVVGRVEGTSFVMLRPDRCEIAKELYWGLGRRPHPRDAFAVEVMAKLAGASDCFFDIGAYTGLFTLVTARVNPTLAVHAFEIVPEVAKMLRANAVRNGIQERVTVHMEGIGEPTGAMVVPSGAGGSALPSFYSSRMRFEEGVTVPFRSMDSIEALVPDADSQLLVKIDVEGTEDVVFRHGRRLLQRFRPDILCEILPSADGRALESLLEGFGFQFYGVGESTLVPFAHIEPDPRFRDWLLTPRDPPALRGLGIRTHARSILP